MNNHDNIKKIVLAYSGGLDTSIIIPWLKENYNNPEIIAVAGNVGQADELEGLEAKAIATGASKLIVADLVDEMVDEVIIPALKMDAKYETYLLGTAFARPVIGKKLAQIALAEGADAICHGCTGKGNEDWNCSAPHGAGRLMSRRAAFASLSMEEYREQMKGIFSTCVLPGTLDESPMAYKTMDEIVKNIHPTAEILCHIRPVYNFKAAE